MNRRGYALVLAMIVALVGSMSIAIVLNRQGVERLSSQRQLEAYNQHHLKRGVKEAVSAYVLSIGGRSPGELVDEEGRALDLVTPTAVLRVYLQDAQGAMLVDPSLMGNTERREAMAIAEQVSRATGKSVRFDKSGVSDELQRRFGPPQVSVGSAAPEVIKAIIAQIQGDADGDAFVRAIQAARQQGRPLTQADIDQAATAANLSPVSRSNLPRFLTAQPTIWRLTVDLIPSTGPSEGRTVSRYTGMASIGGVTPSRSRSSSPLSGDGPIVDWRQVDLSSDALRSGGGKQR